MPNILFVCGTNRSRSPMAAAVFKKLAEAAGVTDLTVDSAGLHANPHLTVFPEVIEILAQEGTQPLHVGAKQLLAKHIKTADLVLCFTSDQQKEIESKFLPAKYKTRTVMSILRSDAEIFDPAKGGLIKYRQCLEMMLPALETLAKRIL